jgi:glutamate racemase
MGAYHGRSQKVIEKRDGGRKDAGIDPDKLILVFDSGVGGLSVLAEIQKMYPGVPCCYVADNEGYPYGNKSEDSLTKRILKIFEKLLTRLQPSIIVIACNTASTLVLQNLRAVISIPIVGVVPAIKPAAKLSQTKVIGLLATQGTVRRKYTDDLIYQFARECTVIKIGASHLVEEAEKKLRSRAVDKDLILRELNQLFSSPKGDRVDVVVLGCTHFPLLKAELQELSPRKVMWIDSGESVAHRVGTVLNADAGRHEDSAGAAGGTAYFTAKREDVEELRASLMGFGLGDIEFFEV